MFRRRSRHWLNFGLLLAVLGLGGLFLLPGSQAPTLAPQRVSDTELSAIEAASFHSPPAVEVEIERRGPDWWLKAPISTPANNVRVGALLSLATAPAFRGFAAAEADLKQYGLAPPRAELRVGDLSYLLGDTEPLDGHRYVLHGGLVRLVEDSFFQFIGAGPASFIHSAPLAAATRVRSVRMPEALMTWDGSRWRSEGLGEPPPDWLNEAAGAWLRAQAVMVRPLVRSSAWNEEISFGLDGVDSPLTFWLRFTDHEVVLGRPGFEVQYHLLRSAIQPLMIGPAAGTSASN